MTAAWKTEKLQVGAPNSVDIKADADDGLIIRFRADASDLQGEVRRSTDPAPGQYLLLGITLSLHRSGTDGFDATQAVKGQTVSSFAWRLSSDSKTLTQTGTIGGNPASAQKATVVYDCVGTGS